MVYGGEEPAEKMDGVRLRSDHDFLKLDFAEDKRTLLKGGCHGFHRFHFRRHSRVGPNLTPLVQNSNRKEPRRTPCNTLRRDTVRLQTEGTDMDHNLSLAEAATAVGRGETTVREWAKSGSVQATKDARGRWQIERGSLLARAATEARTDVRSRAGASAEPPSEARLVRVLQAEIDHLRRLLDEERVRNQRLEEERTQHMAEMRAILNKDTEGFLSRWIRR